MTKEPSERSRLIDDAMDHHIISTNLEITSSKFVRVWERITSALVSKSKLRKETRGIKTKAPHTTQRKTQERKREREHSIHEETQRKTQERKREIALNSRRIWHSRRI